ncbi:hypothetical protein FI667_g6418, partial [Globisporangium splendens]
MDEEARAREQEIKELEMQMLERARKEKECIATRNAAASKIQSLVRGYIGCQRVEVIQDKIEKERETRAKALEATLAEAEAKVAEALSADATSSAEDESSDTGEWVEYWDENVQASYFYNICTQEASWTRPVSAPSVSSKALEIVLTATTPTVDHEEDNYANYSLEMVGENGYPGAGAGGEGYADQYGYYDQCGQYHYYEEVPANANAAAAYSGAQMMRAAGMYPGYASAYAYQAAMASMMFGTAMGFANPMMQQCANPMMQQYANPMTAQPAASPTETVSDTGAAPPDPWEKFFDQYTGAAYYYNNITGEKYWA